jgi:iron complex outermembrane receptor protein
MTKSTPRLAASLLTAASLLASASALAQDSGSHSDAHASPHGSAHDDDPHDDTIVVAGHPPVDFAILSATSTLAGDALLTQTRGQLGETLARLPGVSATSFAPGASRPVLRGFSGDRVAVLIDGIGAIDASTVSVDHAVVFDPLAIDHIDVFHGPALLLFGGNAIGGAVNALDKRIPRRVPENISASLTGGYGTAADERALGGAIDFALGPRLAAHVDASWRKSDDLRVGGKVLSPALRADLLADAAEHRADGEPEEAEELEELAGMSGRVPGTAARTATVGAGLAFIDAAGNIGISVQRFDTRYGVPLRPGAGHHHGEEEEAQSGEEEGHEEGESVSIDLVQTRVDLRAALEMSGAFDSLQFRGAYGDYEHVELEGDEVGTRFAGNGVEFRADLVQAERNGWRGRSGIQTVARKLDIDGAEAFTPDYELGRTGLFTLQSLKFGGSWTIEGALRFERAQVSVPQEAIKRSFSLWSGAAGLAWESEGGLTLGVNYVRGARAPSPEELLSDGPHIATQAYELGDPTFGKETSDGFEAYVRYQGDRASLALAGFLNEFDGYIALSPRDEERDELPLFEYEQADARFVGFEASGSIMASRWDDGEITLTASADYTRARLKGIGPAPLIPPLRARGGIEFRQGTLRLHSEVEWNDRQDRVGAVANPVRSFTLVNLGADWHPMGEEGPLTITASAENLFDVVGRRAASITRDFVPLPGRDVRVTARLAF